MYDWMKEYLYAFKMLNQTRQVSEIGMGPISLSEILAYLQLYGASDPDDFVHYILLMDSEYLSIQAKKSASKAKPDRPERPQRNGRQPASTERK